MKYKTTTALFSATMIATQAWGVTPTKEELALARQWRTPQFSFVYDNAPSQTLLSKWKLTEETQRLDPQRTQHTRTYVDPQTGLQVRCVAIEYQDFPAIEWVMYFSNLGKTNSPILEKIMPLALRLPAPTKNGFVLHHTAGEFNSGKSFAPLDKVFSPGDSSSLTLAPTGGRSSDGVMPFFNVDWHTGGVAVAVGWSGQWEATCAPDASGALTVQAGQQQTHFTLHPGESVRTPRILMVFWDGNDPLRGNNLFRQLLIQHYLPRRNGQLVYPPICASITTVDPGGDYEGPHLRAMPALAKQGYEVFWSDMDPQQWYPGGFPAGTGNWEVDLTKYPHGLKPIGAAAHQAGLGYLLWFEPERVHPGTKVQQEHPEWVLKPDGEWSQLFALHIPAARRWLTDRMDKFVTEAQVDWMRWDFNIAPLGFWRRNDTPDRQGITEIQYIEGLYAMWDDLESRHPGLVIDVCASGGRRIDLETLSRGLPLWHSDMQCDGPNPAADQLQNAGLFRWVPLHGCAAAGYEPDYIFRSAMTGGNIHMQTGNPTDMGAAIKRTTAILRKVRPYLTGDFYPLFPHREHDVVWFGYQFHRPDLNAGMVLLFRRERCFEESASVKLQSIDAQAKYEVCFEDTAEKRTLTGVELASLKLTVPTTPGSVLVFYKKID